MNPQLWQRLRDCYSAAIEQEPEHWPALIRQAAAENPELGQELAALLTAHREAADFLIPAQLTVDPLVDTTIGPYRLLHRLGAGGMGVVYLAVRVDGEFRRRVALKVLKPGMDSEEIVRRFRAERQILAALDHPNIVRLLDGGTTERGLPYFVLEYVEGRSLDEFCRARQPSLNQRLDLFTTICAAVEFAHQNLVVHRDLKPSNILITDDGVPKLLDFGIAKLLNPDLAGATVAATAPAAQPLTPDYASPEQLRGERITTASDVYSLGVLLFQLLTDELPLAQGRRDPPERPSVVRRRGLAKGANRRRLDPDLDAIVLKALRAEPRERYSSVSRLSDDLRRLRSGLPISAGKGSTVYRMQKFVQRHRVGVAVSATIALTTLGFGIGMTVLAVRLVQERDQVALEQQRAERVTQFLTELFQVSDPSRATGETLTARQLLDQGAAQLEQALADQPAVRVELDRTVGTLYRRLGLYDKATPFLERALLGCRKLYGENHLKTAVSLNALGRLKLDRADYGAAEKLFRQAGAVLAELPISTAEAQVANANDLAITLYYQGHYESAEQTARQALALAQEHLGAEHPAAIRSRTALGVVLWARSRFAESEMHLRQVLEIRRQVLGNEHVEIAEALTNLALPLQGMGRYAAAEPLHREALAINRKLLGEDHPRVALGWNNLGFVLGAEGRLTEALAAHRQALAIQRKVFGENHTEVARSLLNLGTVLHELGDLAEAEAALTEGLAINRRVLGQDHPANADLLRILGNVRLSQGEPEAARHLFEQALAIRRDKLGDVHSQVAGVYEDLARVYIQEKEFLRAEELARQSLAILHQVFPAGSPLIAEAEGWLARSLIGQQRYAEAEALLRKSLETLVTERGERAPPTREVLGHLVELYSRWQRPQDAARYLERLEKEP